MIERIYRLASALGISPKCFTLGQMRVLAEPQTTAVQLPGELPCLRWFVTNPAGVDEHLAYDWAEVGTPLQVMTPRGMWHRRDITIERKARSAAWVCVHYELTPPSYWFTFDARA